MKKKPIDIKLNSRINVFEQGRLLRHCPMKVIYVEKSQHDTWVQITALDTEDNIRFIKHEKFTIEILKHEKIRPNRPS